MNTSTNRSPVPDSRRPDLTGPATQGRQPPAYSPTTVRDVYLLVGLEVAAILLWALWRTAGVDLTVDLTADTGGTTDVGVAAVAVTTALVTTAAFGLRELLGRLRVRRGLRAWTIVATAVWLVSFLGPTAATTTDAGAALTTFHLLVGAGVIAGVRRLHAPERPAGLA
jgi:hypothetical protein